MVDYRLGYGHHITFSIVWSQSNGQGRTQSCQFTDFCLIGSERLDPMIAFHYRPVADFFLPTIPPRGRLDLDLISLRRFNFEFVLFIYRIPSRSIELRRSDNIDDYLFLDGLNVILPFHAKGDLQPVVIYVWSDH